MRVSETYSNPPSANIFEEMACYLNLQKEVVHKYRFNKSAGEYIFLEMRSTECKSDLSLNNAYVNLFIEFKRRYKKVYKKEWKSKYYNIKNP